MSRTRSGTTQPEEATNHTWCDQDNPIKTESGTTLHVTRVSNGIALETYIGAHLQRRIILNTAAASQLVNRLALAIISGGGKC